MLGTGSDVLSREHMVPPDKRLWGRPFAVEPHLLARRNMSTMRPTPASTERNTFRRYGIALWIIFLGAFALAFAFKHAPIRVQMLNGSVILFSMGGLLLFGCIHAWRVGEAAIGRTAPIVVFRRREHSVAFWCAMIFFVALTAVVFVAGAEVIWECAVWPARPHL